MFISFQTGTRIQIVLAEDVEWIGAAGDYVELHVSGRCSLFRETMASLMPQGLRQRIPSPFTLNN
jgi:DNA-binding LytR/AlgR family response regulator